MHTPHPGEAAMATTQQQLNRRYDTGREVLVERAIAIQAGTSTMSAVEFLKAHQFTAPVIVRILFQHDARRAR